MICPEWQKRQVVPPLTKEVWYELLRLGMDLYDVAYILENGYDCPSGKRSKGIIEKCIRRRNKIIKVVVELKLSRRGIEYWKLRHVGEYGV